MNDIFGQNQESEINIHLISPGACSPNCNEIVIPQATQVSEQRKRACSESRLPLDGTVSLYFDSRPQTASNSAGMTRLFQRPLRHFDLYIANVGG